AWCEIGDLLRQCRAWDCRVVGGGDVSKPSGLLLHGLADFFTAVPCLNNPQPGDAVDVFLTIDIVQASAITVVEDLKSLFLGQLLPRRAMNPNVFQSALGYFVC